MRCFFGFCKFWDQIWLEEIRSKNGMKNDSGSFSILLVCMMLLTSTRTFCLQKVKENPMRTLGGVCIAGRRGASLWKGLGAWLLGTSRGVVGCSIFEGQPPPKQGQNSNQKQGSFGYSFLGVIWLGF